VEVKNGRRHFDNAFQSVAKMILEEKEIVEKVLVHGKNTFDFKI